ncbi:MAG: hypothetical protein R3E79_24605 [Caldilineaceae bacterium]
MSLALHNGQINDIAPAEIPAAHGGRGVDRDNGRAGAQPIGIFGVEYNAIIAGLGETTLAQHIAIAL